MKPDDSYHIAHVLIGALLGGLVGGVFAACFLVAALVLGSFFLLWCVPGVIVLGAIIFGSVSFYKGEEFTDLVGERIAKVVDLFFSGR